MIRIYQAASTIVLFTALLVWPYHSTSAETLNKSVSQQDQDTQPQAGSAKQSPFNSTHATAEEAGKSALAILKSPQFFRAETGGLDRAKRLGFESIEEVAGATLGKALPVLKVSLEKLRDFQPDDDPKSLVISPYVVMYPIYVQSEVRSSVKVSDLAKNKKWQPMGRGLPRLIRTIERLRKEQGQPDDAFFLLENRGISLRFLARLRGEKLTLTPLDDFSFGTVELKAGKEYPARDITIHFAPIAKKLFDMYEKRNKAGGKFSSSLITH